MLGQIIAIAVISTIMLVALPQPATQKVKKVKRKRNNTLK